MPVFNAGADGTDPFDEITFCDVDIFKKRTRRWIAYIGDLGQIKLNIAVRGVDQVVKSRADGFAQVGQGAT